MKDHIYVASNGVLIQISISGICTLENYSPRAQTAPELLSAAFTGWCQPLLNLCLCAQDIKNADLALYELNRVITLEPNWPEVYEQRAEVRPNPVHLAKRSQAYSQNNARPSTYLIIG